MQLVSLSASLTSLQHTPIFNKVLYPVFLGTGYFLLAKGDRYCALAEI